MKSKLINYKTILLLVIIFIILGFLYYVKVYNKFILNGDTEIILFNLEEYEEPGYKLVDFRNNDISEKVDVQNNIDIEKPGNYEVKYLVNGKVKAIRKVVVKKVTFKLNGEENMVIDLNSENNTYIEPGFIVIDENNVDYHDKVEITGNVNTDILGTYEIKYTLKLDGYEKILTRNVQVVKYIKEISLNVNNLIMYVNDEIELSASYNPLDVSNADVTWTSSNPKIVDVVDGKINALSEGVAEITIKTINNKEAKCIINVQKRDDNIIIVLNKTAYTGNEIKANIVNYSGSEINQTFYTDASCNTKINSANPINIGTYYVIAESLGNIEYLSKKTSCTKAVVITKVPVKIRVGTFNMGQYICGTGKYNCRPSYKDFASYFNTSKVDIMGLQEAEEYRMTDKAAKETGFNNNFFKTPASTLGVISKYSLIDKSFKELVRCKENRGIEKTVFEVNGVNISFYNTHFSYQSECIDKHFASAASIIKNDPNPSIIVGDYNTTSIVYYEKYFKPLGYEIAAYDDTTTNMWGKASYCDAIYVNSKGHIDILNNETITTFNKVSDHNLVIANLNVY